MCQPLLEDECQIDILVEMVGWVNRTSYPQAIQHGLGDVSFNAVRRVTSILHTSMLSKSAPSADMEQSTLRSRMRLSSIATSSPLTVAKFPEISIKSCKTSSVRLGTVDFWNKTFSNDLDPVSMEKTCSISYTIVHHTAMVTPCRDELTICDHYNSQLTILVEVDQLTFDRIRHRLSPRRK